MAVGSTNFPTPISLASSWDPELITRIFTAAALETRIRGSHHVLGPNLDLASDPRWARTEETYGEDRYFGHLAYEVDDIYATCERLMKLGITINRPPRDGQMAFIRSPDLHSIELLQKGDALAPQEPWSSMPNTGHW